MREDLPLFGIPCLNASLSLPIFDHTALRWFTLACLLFFFSHASCRGLSLVSFLSLHQPFYVNSEVFAFNCTSCPGVCFPRLLTLKNAHAHHHPVGLTLHEPSYRMCSVMHFPWSWTAHATQSLTLFSLTAMGFTVSPAPFYWLVALDLFSLTVSHTCSMGRPVLVVITVAERSPFLSLLPSVHFSRCIYHRHKWCPSHPPNPHWHHSFFFFFVNNFSLKPHSKKNKRKGILHMKWWIPKY